jgi:hypothetical protein
VMPNLGVCEDRFTHAYLDAVFIRPHD